MLFDAPPSSPPSGVPSGTSSSSAPPSSAQPTSWCSPPRWVDERSSNEALVASG